MRNLIIKLLGGFTKEEIDDQKSQYADWVFKYLKPIDESVMPDCSYYHPFNGDKIIKLRPSMKIITDNYHSLNIAPWC